MDRAALADQVRDAAPVTEPPTSQPRRWPEDRPRPVLRFAVVALATLVGLTIGAIWNAVQDSRYESTVRLLVGPIGGERTTLDAAGLLSRTYAEVVSSRSVVQRVSEDLGTPIDPGDVSALSDERSRVIVLTVRSSHRRVPAPVADALAAELGEVVSSRPQPPVEAAAGTEAGQVRVLDPATDPQEVRDAAVFVLLGTSVLGGLFGLGWARSPRSLGGKVDHRFLETLGIPVVTAHDGGPQQPGQYDTWDLVVTQIGHECRRSGSYQSVAYVPTDDDPDVVTAFLHVVIAEARTGRPVEFMDADPSHDRLGQRLPTPGPYERSQGRSEQQEHIGPPIVAYTTDDRPLVPPGTDLHYVEARSSAGAIGAMARVQRVADQLRAASALAALAPPINSSPAAVSASVVVDRVVLVVRRARTTRRAVTQGMRALESVGVTPAVVLEIDADLEIDPIELR